MITAVRPVEHTRLRAGMVAFISGILLFYELLYTRIISAVLSNSYVFLIISLSVIGYGFGCLLFQRRSLKVGGNEFSEISLLSLSSILFSTVFFILIFAYFIPYIHFLFYILPVALPFIIGGYLFSQLYTRYKSEAPRIYAFDMTGAIAGLVAGMFIINLSGVILPVLAIGFLASAMFFITLWQRRRRYAIAPAIMCAAVIFIMFNQEALHWINRNFTGLHTGPGSTLTRIRDNGDTPEIIASEWDAFSRTDVISVQGKNRERTVTIDGSANAAMVFAGEDDDFPQYLERSIDFLPYTLRKTRSVAVIGAGGGRDVMLALAGGAEYVDAVEINRSTVELTRRMRDYNGNVFDRSEVNVHIDDGRSFIQRSEKKYDLIFLSMVMTGNLQAEGMVTADTFIYTKEAVRSYIRQLTPEGQLAFVVHGIQDAAKVLRTVLEIVNEGESYDKYSLDQLILSGNVMQHTTQSMLHTPVLLFSNSPYSRDEIRKAERFLKNNSFTPIILGGHVFLKPFDDILRNVKDSIPFNFSPATDDKPFFYHYSKKLPGFLGLLLVISIGFPLVVWGRNIIRHGIGRQSLYFSLTGMGFMMFEVLVIQRLSLVLGHSVTAFVFGISIILGGAGIGSLAGGSAAWRLKKPAPVAAGALIFAAAVLLSAFGEELMTLGVLERMLITGPFLLLISFFQGMIFPHALGRARGNVPLFYGLNSSFSLVGSILSIILVFLVGNTISMMISAMVYISLYVMRESVFE